MTSTPAPASLRSAWPDVLAFVGGLAMAWCFQWKVHDLVWGLWLSSLLVGYLAIVWTVFRPEIGICRRIVIKQTPAESGLTYLLGGLLFLLFFTFHFGFFHLFHSALLNAFFPISEGRGIPNLSAYGAVFVKYWPFVLAVALAEREAFRAPSLLTAGFPTAVSQVVRKLGDSFWGPYRNVIRMHCLLVLFALTHFVRLESFGVYAVVSAVYFFPWRLITEQ